MQIVLNVIQGRFKHISARYCVMYDSENIKNIGNFVLVDFS